MYEEDLKDLEDGIQRLKIEYDIYFNGSRKRPPDDLRGRVDRLVKKLSGATDMSFNQRFRFNTLTARYYLFRDLWRRNRRASEGTGPRSILDTGRQADTPQQLTSSQPPVQLSVSISETRDEETKVRELYQAVLRLRGTDEEDSPDITYAQFAKYISGQTAKIRSKFHCSSVTFTVARENGSVKFTARAESPEQSCGR